MKHKADMSELFVKLIKDSDFKSQFKQNPKAYLKEYIGEWDDTREIKIVEDSLQKKHFVIRSEEDMNKISHFYDKTEALDQLKKMTQTEEQRKEFKRNPYAALEKLGITLPKSSQIIILEDTSETTYWVLPDLSEISEDELAQLSGGNESSKAFLQQYAKSYNPLTYVLFAPFALAAGIKTVVDDIRGK